MRHRVAKKHLSRTPAHLKAMRRNMAQSLFQYGQIETTLAKAKAVRPFVERLITIARRGTLQSRQRVSALLNDRSILDREQEEKYEQMSDPHRRKVMVARSGRRHCTGRVPASYNKKKFPFVAQSVVHKLMTEIAPAFADRPGGYTRIIRLAKRRIGDNSDLAILQLVGGEDEESPAARRSKKVRGQRRERTQNRIRYLEGKKPRRSRRRGGEAPAAASDEPVAEAESPAPEQPTEERPTGDAADPPAEE